MGDDLKQRMREETECTLQELDLDYLDTASNPELFATALDA